MEKGFFFVFGKVSKNDFLILMNIEETK